MVVVEKQQQQQQLLYRLRQHTWAAWFQGTTINREHLVRSPFFLYMELSELRYSRGRLLTTTVHTVCKLKPTLVLQHHNIQGIYSAQIMGQPAHLLLNKYYKYQFNKYQRYNSIMARRYLYTQGTGYVGDFQPHSTAEYRQPLHYRGCRFKLRNTIQQ